MDVISRAMWSRIGGLVGLALLACCTAGCGGDGSSPAEAGAKSVSISLHPVRPPAAPRPYAVPAGALQVSSSGELATALADGRRETIVLAPGTYDSPRAFSDREGDQLYASRLGRSVLKAGIVLGSNTGPPGALIRGLTFDVRDPAKTFEGDIVHVWGSATNASVLDTRLNGHGAVDAGLVVRQPRGFVGRRIVAKNFRSYGIVVDPNDPGFRTKSPFVLRDLAISHVRRPVRGSSNGRAEACLWIGSPGTVRRVRVRNCGITGIWTGTATRGSVVASAAVDRAPVGIYIEHFTTGSSFQRLRIGPNVSRGVNAEWSNVALGQKPASVGNVIEDCLFRTTHVGVYLDQGTTRTLVRRCEFSGQRWAAIGDYLGNGNRFYENDFAGLADGAVAVSHDHDPAGGRGP
ncbi:MAG TPA: right-handed parallel beta-helix repeat-containing protein [Gaiellaceae bacterium]